MADLRAYAHRAAGIADAIFYSSTKLEHHGIRHVAIPAEEAEKMKADLLKISGLLNDWADERDSR